MHRGGHSATSGRMPIALTRYGPCPRPLSRKQASKSVVRFFPVPERARQLMGGLFEQRVATVDAPPSTPVPESGAKTPTRGMSIELHNNERDVTVITISGKDEGSLLVGLMGVLNSMDLQVVSALIETADGGKVVDVFRVKTSNGEKVPEADFPGIQEALLAVTGNSSKSSQPAIYGVIAAAEAKRLRPLSTSASEGDAAALELAAAEMAQAAATLVALERSIIANHTNPSVDLDSAEAVSAYNKKLDALEEERAEAAAQLERHMAAMEAVLAGRRVPMRVSKDTSQTGDTAIDMLSRLGGRGTMTGTGPGAGNGKELVLQGFNWESCKQPWYKVLTSHAKEIAAAGFTAVWLPPPSNAVSPQGYLPRDLYCLESKYGTEAELRECIAELHSNDLKAIADIVINHRCAHDRGDDGKWNKFGGRLAWDASHICNNNHEYGGRGHHKTGEDYTAAPNIDHTQERVRNDIIGWMNHLRNVGFDGWRFDFVKGYSGEFSKIYIDATTPEMAFGEFWDTCEYTDGVLDYNQDAHRQRTVNWIDATGGTSAAFDFTTKGILQEACGRREYWRLVDSQGKPPGVIGLWPSRAITFLENHDTGSTLNHWPFPHRHLAEGYAYIITHPGTPCIFYDHFWQNDQGLGQSIRELLKIRKQLEIHCRSEVTVRKATAEVYAATVDDKLAMKIGGGDWCPQHSNLSGTWNLACCGNNFAVWLCQ